MGKKGRRMKQRENYFILVNNYNIEGKTQYLGHVTSIQQVEKMYMSRTYSC